MKILWEYISEIPPTYRIKFKSYQNIILQVVTIDILIIIIKLRQFSGMLSLFVLMYSVYRNKVAYLLILHRDFMARCRVIAPLHGHDKLMIALNLHGSISVMQGAWIQCLCRIKS
jgi:hypothetical protein